MTLPSVPLLLSRLHFEALRHVPVLVLNISEDFSENAAKQEELMGQVSRAWLLLVPSAELSSS